MTIKQIVNGYEDVLRTSFDDDMPDNIQAYIESLDARDVEQLLDFAKNVTDVIRKQLEK